MEIRAKTCPSCDGSGHDKGGMPRVEMVEFDPYEHNAYISDMQSDQKRYHKTIKRGSGCMNCGGIGYIELEAS